MIGGFGSPAMASQAWWRGLTEAWRRLRYGAWPGEARLRKLGLDSVNAARGFAVADVAARHGCQWVRAGAQWCSSYGSRRVRARAWGCSGLPHEPEKGHRGGSRWPEAGLAAAERSGARMARTRGHAKARKRVGEGLVAWSPHRGNRGGALIGRDMATGKICGDGISASHGWRLQLL